MRGALCVVVRDLIVFGVLGDMMRGRPAVYATFSSYDEVAHHSGLERADTMEALRKLDQQFGRLARARRYAPRPRTRSSCSPTTVRRRAPPSSSATVTGLDELVERSLEDVKVDGFAGGDEQHAMVPHQRSPRRPAVPTPRRRNGQRTMCRTARWWSSAWATSGSCI